MKRCSQPFLSSRRLTDLRHPTVADLVQLVDCRDERERRDLFYTEGMRFIAQALESRHAVLEAAVFSPDVATHPFVRSTLLPSLHDRHVPVIEVSAPIFRRLSQVPEPQGIGAIVRQRFEPLRRVGPEAGLCWLALDTVRSPGNLGTVLRTLEAVGGTGVILIGNGIDPYAPQVVRATMGAHFNLRFVRTDAMAFSRWREQHGVTLVGTSPHATEDYRSFRYPPRTVLWFGGEKKGLSEEQIDFCDEVVRIPMVGKSDSLNLASAAAVVLYEVFAQRDG